MTDQPPSRSRRAARAAESAAAGVGDGSPSGGAAVPPPVPRRPRGRDRYAGQEVVVDAPSSVRYPTSAPEAGRRRLVLSPHETEAVRPPAQLPRVAPTPVPAPAGRRLIASGRYERPLTEPDAGRAAVTASATEVPAAATEVPAAAAAEVPAGASAVGVPATAEQRGADGARPGPGGEPPAVTRSLTVQRGARRAARPGGRRAAATPPAGTTLVLGVLNVTPDSFSDGGRWTDLDAALAHGRSLVAAGADVVDVGGESTRPGATRVEPDEELRRVLPVVRELAAEGVRVSIDTVHAGTAAAALEAGAEIVNDVSGGLADADMARVVAESGRTFVAMHWRGFLDAGPSRSGYDDVVADVRDELARRVDALVDAGVAREALVLDPGLGFSKAGLQNWQLLARLHELATLGLPLLVGASRKRFLGELLPDGADPVERDAATAVVSVLASQAGAWGVRVHDVAGTRAALDVLGAWREGAREPSGGRRGGGARRARHA